MSEEFQIVESGYIKLGKPGHYVQGTLTEVGDFEGEYGKAKRYELKVDEAKGENKDGKDFSPEKGSSMSFLGHWMIDEKMKNIKKGQRFKVTYKEDKDSTKRKGKTYKVFEVAKGSMDEEYMKENPSSMNDLPEGAIEDINF